MEDILIPVEALHTAKHELEYVISQKRRERPWIHLLNVQRPIMVGEVSYFRTVDMIIDARHASGARVLQPLQALLKREGIKHTARIVLGDPADAIVRHAVEQGATSIVMSTSRRSAIGRLVLGSVAAKVINLTNVPVTLLKQTREADIPALLEGGIGEECPAWGSGESRRRIWSRAMKLAEG